MVVPALCGLWANLPMATGLVCGDNSSSFPMPMPLDDNGMPMCALGFNCPSFNPSDPSTYPQFCAPTPQCIVGRAFGERCPRQSAQEPEVCHGGYYCPTATDVFICPEGHYCPPAAYKPIKCPPLSFCPEGSDHLVYFGGVAASLCLLLALVIMLVLYRKHWRYSQLAVIAGKGERFVDAVSPKSMRKRRKSTESNTGLRRYPTMVFDQAPPENHVSAFFTASTHSHNAFADRH